MFDHILYAAAEYEFSAFVSGVRPQVYDMVGSFDDNGVVFYHHNAVSFGKEAVKTHQQFVDVIKMKSGRRLVKNEKYILFLAAFCREGKKIGQFQTLAFSAAERVFAILDEEPEKADVPNAKELKDVDGAVLLKNVTFGYTKDKTILKNVSVNAKKGHTVAIVGPTGAGKTTIINLLMRFYDQQSGEILIDGKQSVNLKRSNLRRAFTMVLQDTWLFYGTIYDNIVYGKEDATPEEVYAAAKSARIDSYIEGLPDGYNTVLSDDGVNISKGQKQLITIARAFLSDSPILILDEATSNVDSRTEIQIQTAMTELMKNKTCFIIAHRLSTIKNADTILVVKDGSIIEQGNHEQLIKQGGFYYSLFNSQFD